MRPMLRAAAASAALLYATSGMARTPFERGVAALDAERYQEAIAAFTQAITEARNDTDLPQAHFHRGKAEASRGNCKAAIEDWMVALAVEAPPDVYANLAYCHFQLEQYQEAILFLEFDALNFPNTATFILLGKAQGLTDDFDGASAGGAPADGPGPNAVASPTPEQLLATCRSYDDTAASAPAIEAATRFVQSADAR